jgi:oxygen-dependent protoporphyrinogen oxidase
VSVSALDVAVVGGGIAGLAAAAVLADAGRQVALLEATDRVGGSAWSERRDGYLFERGANTFRLGPEAAGAVAALGLEPLLLAASPASRARFLLRSGRLVPLPTGPLAFARSELLSARGKLRLLAEPFVRGGDPTGETVAAFASRRLGAEACVRLVGPFLTGVYAGDEERLGAESVFPSLVAAERRSGSIVRGLLASALRRGGSRGRPGSWSTRSGMSGLPEALASRLEGAVRRRCRVVGIGFDAGLYRFEIEGESSERELRSRGLVLALPAPAAASLLQRLDPDAAEAAGTIAYAPVASLSLGLDPAAVRESLRGFGFLVPRGEGEALLGCLFPSALFPDRAPPGRGLVTLLAGGVRRPDVVDRPDDALLASLVAELDAALGLRGPPLVLGIARWPRAVPQPGPEHVRLVAGIRARLARFPRLAVAGAAWDGVAFADALASGVRAGRALLEPSRENP